MCVCVSACCLQSATVILREAMSVEEFLASACSRKNLNPMEHFLRVKKRKDMEDHNYFVPHRTDLVETYVSTTRDGFFTYTIFCSIFFANIVFSLTIYIELSKFRHHVVFGEISFRNRNANRIPYSVLLFALYKPPAQNVVIVVVVNTNLYGFAKVLARLTRAD
jgi:Raf-like Ras-binding domain